MANKEKAMARMEAREVQKAITNGWKEVASKYPYLIEDFTQFADGLAQWYRYCAEEQEMGGVPIDDHKTVTCLQNAKVCDTVRTYITSRIDQDVAQPIKN